MLDFVFFCFFFLVVVVAIWAFGDQSPSSSSKKHDAVLIVAGDNYTGNKVTSTIYEYKYQKLKELAGGNAKDSGYYGPQVRQVLTDAGMSSASSVLFYTAGSKKVQKMVAGKDLDGWIIAIDRGDKPLSWDGRYGPYLLYKKTADRSKYVPRLLRIEAK
jgi:hypothetical protein